MQNSASSHTSPELPSFARYSLARVPVRLQVGTITRSMNTMFAAHLAAGELQFLDQRVVTVVVTDAMIRFSITLDRGRLRASNAVPDADLTIAGTAYTFLLLATRKEDADTLFFRRQLKTSGDTELGLHVKYFLDGLEPETLPYHRTVDRILHGCLELAKTVDTIRSRLANLRPPF